MSKHPQRPERPQFSFSGDDDCKTDSTEKCSKPTGKAFAEKRAMNITGSSDFLCPQEDISNLGHQAQLHKDVDEYNQKVYGDNANNHQRDNNNQNAACQMPPVQYGHATYRR